MPKNKKKVSSSDQNKKSTTKKQIKSTKKTNTEATIKSEKKSKSNKVDNNKKISTKKISNSNKIKPSNSKIKIESKETKKKVTTKKISNDSNTKKNNEKPKKEIKTKTNLFLLIKDKFKKKNNLKSLKGKKKDTVKDRKKITKTNETSKEKKKTRNKFSFNLHVSNSESVFSSKTKKCLLTVTIICLLIILAEGIYLINQKINLDNKTVYYDSLNSIVIDDTDIVAVGSSNFKYSKNYSYTNGLEKAKIIKYDKKGKIIFEKMYEKGINTTFSSIISVKDGYIVVGSGVFSKEEEENEAREAIIVKYDKEGKIIWEKFYQVVTNTRFNKVIETNDGYVVIGQSIYANMEMGNHTTGGGIIVKYDFDGNEIWHNNHGGMKSGNFNDIVEVNGSFYVAGKDASDSGNIIKYSKEGKYEWHKNYSYTDGIGFTGIAYLENSLYVVGSKKVLADDITEDSDRNTTNTDALLVVYDLNGNKKMEKTFGGSNYERYNSILSYHNNLYVAGHISSKDTGFKVETDGKLMTGIVVRYDKDGNILKKEIFGGSNNDNLTDIITDGASLYISGYSNSKDGNITTAKNNGKDYFGKVIKLDFKFRTLMVK